MINILSIQETRDVGPEESLPAFAGVPPYFCANPLHRRGKQPTGPSALPGPTFYNSRDTSTVTPPRRSDEKTRIHTYIERLTKRDRGLPYRTLSGPCRNTGERFRPSCSFPRSFRLPRTLVTRSNPVLLAQCPPVVLVAHFPPRPCHTFYHSVFLSVVARVVPPLDVPSSLSLSFTSLGLAPSHGEALSLSRLGVAHGLYNFHIVPSRARSQPSGSLAPVAARMKESGAL